MTARVGITKINERHPGALIKTNIVSERGRHPRMQKLPFQAWYRGEDKSLRSSPRWRYALTISIIDIKNNAPFAAMFEGRSKRCLAALLRSTFTFILLSPSRPRLTVCEINEFITM